METDVRAARRRAADRIDFTNQRLDAARHGGPAVAVATGLQAFVIWLVILVWKRDADAVVSST